MLRPSRPRDPALVLRRCAAGVLGAVALVLALRPSAAHPAPAGPVDAPVAVAAADLPAGTVLAARDVRVALVPAGLRAVGSAAEPAGLTGRVLASPVRAGEQLTDVRLVGAGLTALLPPGQVAAPVRLADLAESALVRAGDRVDVLAATGGAAQAERVAAGALVLAAPAPAGNAPAAPAATPSDPAGTAAPGLLLLAVDAPTAARLAAASAAATLTVTLSGR